MSYTRSQWCKSLLAALGNNNPSPFVLNWLIAWTHFETSGPASAAYNLLNTTEPNTPGVVSDFNSAGVKNYDTFEHGIQANAKVLRNGLYPTIVASLEGIANGIQSTEPIVLTLINKELSTWGTGPKENEIVLSMYKFADDSFSGNGPVVVVTDWNKYLRDLPFNTGLYDLWIKNSNSYGSPMTYELKIGENAVNVVQFCERGIMIWINGNGHFCAY